MRLKERTNIRIAVMRMYDCDVDTRTTFDGCSNYSSSIVGVVLWPMTMMVAEAECANVIVIVDSMNVDDDGRRDGDNDHANRSDHEHDDRCERSSRLSTTVEDSDSSGHMCHAVAVGHEARVSDSVMMMMDEAAVDQSSFDGGDCASVTATVISNASVTQSRVDDDDDSSCSNGNSSAATEFETSCDCGVYRPAKNGDEAMDERKYETWADGVAMFDNFVYVVVSHSPSILRMVQERRFRWLEDD